MAGDTASVVFVPSAYFFERIIVYPEVVSHLEKEIWRAGVFFYFQRKWMYERETEQHMKEKRNKWNKRRNKNGIFHSWEAHTHTFCTINLFFSAVKAIFLFKKYKECDKIIDILNQEDFCITEQQPEKFTAGFMKTSPELPPGGTAARSERTEMRLWFRIWY